MDEQFDLNTAEGMGHEVRAVTSRKQRLFCAACCQRLAYRTTNPHLLDAIEVGERYADGAAAGTEVDRAYREVVAHRDQELSHEVGFGLPTAILELLTVVLDPWRCMEAADHEKWLEALESEEAQTDDAHLWDRVCGQEQRAHLALLRDIIGNPFRPVAFSPDWRTDTAVTLARTMYESREFGAMPILADALQDVGCDNDDILSHCRDASATHVRGCWVVDLVLGKE
jgi:hypothetical protein